MTPVNVFSISRQVVQSSGLSDEDGRGSLSSTCPRIWMMKVWWRFQGWHLQFTWRARLELSKIASDVPRHIWVVRCKVCGKEAPYRACDIFEFGEMLRNCRTIRRVFPPMRRSPSGGESRRTWRDWIDTKTPMVDWRGPE